MSTKEGFGFRTNPCQSWESAVRQCHAERKPYSSIFAFGSENRGKWKTDKKAWAVPKESRHLFIWLIEIADSNECLASTAGSKWSLCWAGESDVESGELVAEWDQLVLEIYSSAKIGAENAIIVSKPKFRQKQFFERVSVFATKE